MIPVSSLQDVQIRWLDVRAHNFKLHGFFLYTRSDHYIPEYIDGEGLTDLDIWTGKDCGIFLLHDPPEDWFTYTQSSDHLWWTTFRDAFPMHPASIAPDVPIYEVGNGVVLSSRELLPSARNRGLSKMQIAEILEHFELPSTSHPCLVLFRDLSDREVWFVSFDDLLGLPLHELRKALKLWFQSRDFKSLMET